MTEPKIAFLAVSSIAVVMFILITVLLYTRTLHKTDKFYVPKEKYMKIRSGIQKILDRTQYNGLVVLAVEFEDDNHLEVVDFALTVSLPKVLMKDSVKLLEIVDYLEQIYKKEVNLEIL